MRRVFFVWLGALAAFGAFLACSSDGENPVIPDAGAGPTDGVGLDATIIGESGPGASQDADPGPGDPCGDLGGLLANGQWPLAGACPTRAGYTANHSPSQTRVGDILTLAGGAGGPALGADGTLWVAGTDGNAYHLSLGGQVFQLRTLPGAVKSTPAIDKLGNAVFACEDGNLYSLNQTPVDAGADADVDASKVPLANVFFSIHVGPSDASPVIGPDGVIYVGTNDGNLVAVVNEGGPIKWSKPTGDTRGNSPAIGQNGKIYVGSTDHQLRAFNTDGSTEWSIDLGAEMHQSPAVGGDGTIYIGTADGKLHAVTTDGKEKWTYSGAGGAFVGTPAVYAGQVYAASEDKKVHAVGTADGLGRWTFTTQGTPTSPVIDGDAHIDFASSDGHIYIVSEKGTLYIAGTAKGPVVSAGIAVGNQGLYVVTPNSLDVMGP